MPSFLYMSSSLFAEISFPFLSKSPYSLSLYPFSTAIVLTWTLWSLLPVKYCTAAPKLSGSMTLRSQVTPILSITVVLVGPFDTTSETSGSLTKKSMTFSSFDESTSMSRSPTVSRILLADPATIASFTSPLPFSFSTIDSAAGSPSPSSILPLLPSSISSPFLNCSSLLSPNPSSPAILCFVYRLLEVVQILYLELLV